MKKLITHETKFELLHHSGLFLLWCLIVACDLGYQLEWWWSEPTSGSWRPMDHLHSTVRDLLPTVIWAGLALFAVLIVSNASPERNRAGRIRPISDRQRFIARFLVFCIAVGLPWWLHETIYLSIATDHAPGFIAMATFERAVVSTFFAVCVALLAWSSKSIWIPVVSTLAACLLLVGITFIFGKLETSAPNVNVPGNNTPWILVALSILATITIGWWLGWLWKRRSIRFPFWKQFIPLTASFVVCTFITEQIISLHEQFAVKLIEKPELINQIQGQTNFTFDSELVNFTPNTEETGLPRWGVGIAADNLPEQSFARLVSAKGKWHYENAPDLSFPAHQSHNQLMNEAATRNTLALITETTGGQPLTYQPEGYTKSAVTLTNRKQSAGSLPDRATAVFDLEILKTEGWLELPMDGKWHELGSLGKARYRSKNKYYDFTHIHIHIQYRTNRLLSSPKISPRRCFGLWNPSTNEWINFGHNQPVYSYKVSGKLSASPLEEIIIRIYQNKPVVNIQDFKKWIKNARLFVLEAHVAGRIKQELVENNISETATAVSYNRVVAKPLSDTALEKVTNRLTEIPDGISEDGARKHLYKIATLATDSGAMSTFLLKSLPEEHRGLVKELITQSPDQERFFANIWQPSDRVWLLNLLKTIDPDSLTAANLTAQWKLRNWLDTDTSSEAEFKNRLQSELLHLNGKVSFHEKDKYPEVWEAVEKPLRERWQDEHWQLPFTATYIPDFSPKLWMTGIQLSRLTGNDAYLREVCEIIAKGATRLPFDDSQIKTFKPDIESAWTGILRTLGQNQTYINSPPNQRTTLARKWLESKWKFDPATLTFTVLNHEL